MWIRAVSYTKSLLLIICMHLKGNSKIFKPGPHSFFSYYFQVKMTKWYKKIWNWPRKLLQPTAIQSMRTNVTVLHMSAKSACFFHRQAHIVISVWQHWGKELYRDRPFQTAFPMRDWSCYILLCSKPPDSTWELPVIKNGTKNVWIFFASVA